MWDRIHSTLTVAACLDAEIDYLNGFIVRQGQARQVGSARRSAPAGAAQRSGMPKAKADGRRPQVPTPANQLLCHMVKAKLAGVQQQQVQPQQPQP